MKNIITEELNKIIDEQLKTDINNSIIELEYYDKGTSFGYILATKRILMKLYIKNLIDNDEYEKIYNKINMCLDKLFEM